MLELRAAGSEACVMGDTQVNLPAALIQNGDPAPVCGARVATPGNAKPDRHPKPIPAKCVLYSIGRGTHSRYSEAGCVLRRVRNESED